MISLPSRSSSPSRRMHKSGMAPGYAQFGGLVVVQRDSRRLAGDRIGPAKLQLPANVDHQGLLEPPYMKHYLAPRPQAGGAPAWDGAARAHGHTARRRPFRYLWARSVERCATLRADGAVRLIVMTALRAPDHPAPRAPNRTTSEYT